MYTARHSSTGSGSLPRALHGCSTGAVVRLKPPRINGLSPILQNCLLDQLHQKNINQRRKRRNLQTMRSRTASAGLGPRRPEQRQQDTRCQADQARGIYTIRIFIGAAAAIQIVHNQTPPPHYKVIGNHRPGNRAKQALSNPQATRKYKNRNRLTASTASSEPR